MLLQGERRRQHGEEDHAEREEGKRMTWCVSVGALGESAGVCLLSLRRAHSRCLLGTAR